MNRTIPIYRGDVRSIKTTLKDKTTGAPYDLTGWPVTFSLVGQDGAVALEKLLDEDQDAATGVATAVLLGSETETLVAGMTYTAFMIYDSPSGPVTVAIGVCPIMHPARTLA